MAQRLEINDLRRAQWRGIVGLGNDGRKPVSRTPAGARKSYKRAFISGVVFQFYRNTFYYVLAVNFTVTRDRWRFYKRARAIVWAVPPVNVRSDTAIIDCRPRRICAARAMWSTSESHGFCGREMGCLRQKTRARVLNTGERLGVFNRKRNHNHCPQFSSSKVIRTVCKLNNECFWEWGTGYLTITLRRIVQHFRVSMSIWVPRIALSGSCV